MKKIFLILPLSILMNFVISQDIVNSQYIATLDGKSFKITLAPIDPGIINSQNVNSIPANKSSVNTPEENTGNKNYDSPNSSNTKPSVGSTVSKDNQAGYDDLLGNKTKVLHFENGMMHTSFKSPEKMENCPYTISESDPGIISFNSTCMNTTLNSTKSCTWAGTVDKKNINGTLIINKNDGSNLSYSFSGTETNDSDASKDIGLK